MEEARDALNEVPAIQAAWLFGSHAKGRARPDSDADIAVLTSEALSYKTRLSLMSKLEAIFQTDRVDLVVLSVENPVLSFEAVRGRCIFDRDTTARATFVSLVSRMYEDSMAFLESGMRQWRDPS